METQARSALDRLKASFRADVRAIGEGSYKLIPDDDKACLVYGMLPHKYWEPVERQLKDKLQRVAAPYKALNIAAFDFMPEVAAEENAEIDAWLNKQHREILDQIGIVWLEMAKKEGILQA